MKLSKNLVVLQKRKEPKPVYAKTPDEVYQLVNDGKFAEALNKLKTAPSGDAIREINGCIKDLLDRSCESDVHGEIFKGRASLAKTTQLWNVISEEIKRQSAEMKQLISEVNGD